MNLNKLKKSIMITKNEETTSTKLIVKTCEVQHKKKMQGTLLTKE